MRLLTSTYSYTAQSSSTPELLHFLPSIMEVQFLSMYADCVDECFLCRQKECFIYPRYGSRSANSSQVNQLP
jgi:hypothetical protein